jgi:hypothetical protein
MRRRTWNPERAGMSLRLVGPRMCRLFHKAGGGQLSQFHVKRRLWHCRCNSGKPCRRRRDQSGNVVGLRRSANASPNCSGVGRNRRLRTSVNNCATNVQNPITMGREKNRRFDVVSIYRSGAVPCSRTAAVLCSSSSLRRRTAFSRSAAASWAMPASPARSTRGSRRSRAAISSRSSRATSFDVIAMDVPQARPRVGRHSRSHRSSRIANR